MGTVTALAGRDGLHGCHDLLSALFPLGTATYDQDQQAVATVVRRGFCHLSRDLPVLAGQAALLGERR